MPESSREPAQVPVVVGLHGLHGGHPQLPEAREEYDLLFASLEERAPGQKLLLTAQVQVAAVKELRGDTAKLLVFLDQASQRATDDESSVSAAQLAVDAERIDGTWRITGITPL